jgi:pyruvate formate lyase activating enzyme
VRTGLHFVYTGNVHDREGDTTRCPGCRKALIVRDWYEIDEYSVTEGGQCTGCGLAIPGRFQAFTGAFGRRRIPVALSRFEPGAR